MKFKFIKEQCSSFPVEKMCQALKVSRSGFYAWNGKGESKRQMENRELQRKIEEIFKRSRRLYGSPRVHAELRAQGYTCGINKVARLMKGKFVAKTVKMFRRTTDSNHNYHPAPDLINQNFVAPAPNTIWTSDITYIRTLEGWLYLAIVLDVYSRKVVGWSMSRRLTKEIVITAVSNAIARRNIYGDIIFHSDQGVQYACYIFRNFLKRHRIMQSMSRKGICYDNAITESFFHTLKTEHVYFCHYRTREEARRSLFDYIEIYYNRERRHSSIVYMSPEQFEKMAMSV
jgi:transposase InsO family protein